MDPKKLAAGATGAGATVAFLIWLAGQVTANAALHAKEYAELRERIAILEVNHEFIHGKLMRERAIQKLRDEAQ